MVDLGPWLSLGWTLVFVYPLIKIYVDSGEYLLDLFEKDHEACLPNPAVVFFILMSPFLFGLWFIGRTFRLLITALFK